MNPSEKYLARIKAIAEGGFDVNALGPLRQELCADLSEDTHAAVMWALTETDDPTTIWWMAHVAQHVGILEALPVLREKLPTLPRREGLRDYRDSIRDSIHHLESLADGQCACATATATPASPESRPEMCVDRRVFHKKKYYSTLYVHCKRCGKRFEVTEDPSYHFPICHWHPKPGSGPWPESD
jgi:hypothetical protein